MMTLQHPHTATHLLLLVISLLLLLLAPTASVQGNEPCSYYCCSGDHYTKCMAGYNAPWESVRLTYDFSESFLSN